MHRIWKTSKKMAYIATYSTGLIIMHASTIKKVIFTKYLQNCDMSYQILFSKAYSLPDACNSY